MWAPGQRARFGLGIVLDIQPFRATDDTGRRYRAGYMTPVVEFGSDLLRVTGGVGVAYLRYDAALPGGQSQWRSYSAVGGSVSLSRSLGVQVIWRRTGFGGGFRSDVWSVQLVHLWQP